MIEMGIYGGTFDPPHNGHLAAAELFYDKMGLDKLVIMPSFLPPHKRRSPFDDSVFRLAMVRRAFFGNPRNIVVSDFEIVRASVSYTSETLSAFSSGAVSLSFLCGTDMFLTLDTWHEPDIIFDKCRIVLMRREKDASLDALIDERETCYRQKYHADIVRLHDEPTVISSTEIREMASAGQDISEYVPRPVVDFLTEYRLYG